MNRRAILIGALAAVLPCISFGGVARADSEEIVVIVNKTNKVAPMNRSQLGALFKARSTQFPGDGRAAPVNLPPESPVRREFDLAVLGLKPDEVERFWLDSRIRSGVGSPRKLPGPSAVVRYVASDAAGLGYVRAADLNESVRVVARIRGEQVLTP